MEFKELKDFEAFTGLSHRCYPGMKLTSAEEQERYTEHRRKMAGHKDVHPVGLYDGGSLVGGYFAYDHKIQVYDTKVKGAGIGTVAVDLPYKKQGHAKRIITKFLLDARKNGRILAHLYPFQPGFYQKMGFGIGPELSVYQFHPSQLPTFETTLDVQVLTRDHLDDVRTCYHTWVDQTHGATDIPSYGFAFLEKPEQHTVGVQNEGKLEGYMSFEFKAGSHFLENDLHVRNFFYTTKAAYQALLTQLHNQKDQVRSVSFPTFDEDFSFTLDDPVHVENRLIHSIYHKTAEQGRGLMYRIIDIPAFLESVKHHTFGRDTIRIGWTVKDSLLGETYKEVWQFAAGRPSVTKEEAEVQIELDIGSFSSLMMGCVSLPALEKAGKANVSKPVDLFNQLEKPQCWTFF
ncbi:GNAT family N-acetyltransferase [Halobacillus litoralis]|uniref:GNAT family N-acetyltransferase n=1 Tax=Halobacillus litoralis TaxID=45668 RepID=A0A845DX64_9BACI|nr:GNAT family N-acetyltransferase [Halobacillus litoralis]MYL21419.1 GNAT family N-acetyltransferase [Halobacillus litoralis]